MQFLKHFLRYGKSALLLNRTRAQVGGLQASFRELFAVIHGLSTDLNSLKSSSEAQFNVLKTENEAQSNALAYLSNVLAKQAELSTERSRTSDQKIAAIASAFDVLSRSSSNVELATCRSEALKSTLLLDTFYTALENKFRGHSTDIAQRQLVYLPDIEQALSKLDTRMVLDLGCGRGEWLSLLRKHSFEGIGVDTNEAQLASAREDGLAVHNEDGLLFLRSQPEGRFAAVTAFHIFEHLPFSVLAEWLVEIRRVLCPGGILIAETPNPENLIVGANTFHLDPTHIRPLPSGVLEILSETIGFSVKEVRPLHPHGDLAAALKDLPERTAYLLYGYQDYGLIAERPFKQTA